MSPEMTVDAPSQETGDEPVAGQQAPPAEPNVIEFSPKQLTLLEQRLIEGSDQLGRKVSFRLDGPLQMEEQITHFGGGIAYDPVGSPVRDQIAFVSNDSGNDEIWVINRDGSGANQLTRDAYDWWDKHPSWPPDGSKIVFWSNRTGKRQIWVMDADGGNLYSLSGTVFNDWNPVWIKYTDPPYPLPTPSRRK